MLQLFKMDTKIIKKQNKSQCDKWCKICCWVSMKKLFPPAARVLDFVTVEVVLSACDHSCSHYPPEPKGGWKIH